MACSWSNPLSYGDCAGQVAKSAAGDAFQAIAKSFGQAAQNATGWLWNQLGAATAVHLGGNGFSTLLAVVATIATVVGVGLFVLQIIQSVLRRDPGGLGRALKGLLVAFVAGAAAAGVVNLLLAAVDALCNTVVQTAVGTDPGGLGQLVLGSAATATLAAMVNGAGGAAGVLLLSLAILAAVVIVYLALVVRKVLIVVTAVFAPLAFAGSLADITGSWTRRWIETTVALIVSKLILVLIFLVGYFMLVRGVGQAGSGTTQAVTQLVSGVIILALAGFAPWLALKVVHFTGDHAHQLHALAATSTGGAVIAGRMGQKVLPLAQRTASTVPVGSSGGQPQAGGSDPTGQGSSPNLLRPGQGPRATGPDRNPGSAPTGPGDRTGRPTGNSASSPRPPGGSGGRQGPDAASSGGEVPGDPAA